MKHRRKTDIDRDYLRRCKASTPEQKLEWLAAAVEFACAPKRKVDHRRE